jgi:hypothetical protein
MLPDDLMFTVSTFLTLKDFVSLHMCSKSIHDDTYFIWKYQFAWYFDIYDHRIQQHYSAWELKRQIAIYVYIKRWYYNVSKEYNRCLRKMHNLASKMGPNPLPQSKNALQTYKKQIESIRNITKEYQWIDSDHKSQSVVLSVFPTIREVKQRLIDFFNLTG